MNIQNANALGTAAARHHRQQRRRPANPRRHHHAAEALTLNGTGIANDGALQERLRQQHLRRAHHVGQRHRINSDSGTLTLATPGPSPAPAYGLTVGGAGNTTIASIIGTGTGTLTKDGTGTLTLTGANTYTGLTTVSAGTLELGTAAQNPVLTGGGASLGHGLLVFDYTGGTGSALVTQLQGIEGAQGVGSEDLQHERHRRRRLGQPRQRGQ